VPSSNGHDYREATLRGASLLWEERWEAAAMAYRRALAARPADLTAGRQITNAARDKLDAVESSYAVRAAGRHPAAAA
jgi:hypothetical protein